MKQFLLGLAGLGASAFFGYLAYLRFPAERELAIEDPKWILEHKVSERTVEVTIDGKTLALKIPVNEPSFKKVYNTTLRKEQPTAIEVLRFWVLLGASALLGLYSTFVIVLWIVNKICKRRTSEDTKESLRQAVQLNSYAGRPISRSSALAFGEIAVPIRLGGRFLVSSICPTGDTSLS